MTSKAKQWVVTFKKRTGETVKVVTRYLYLRAALISFTVPLQSLKKDAYVWHSVSFASTDILALIPALANIGGVSLREQLRFSTKRPRIPDLRWTYRRFISVLMHKVVHVGLDKMTQPRNGNDAAACKH